MNAFELDELLAHPSTWVEPPPDLEDLVVWAVADAAPASSTPRTTRARRWRRTASVVAVAAMVALAAVVGGVVPIGTASVPDYAGQLQATGLAPRAHASVGITRTDAGFRVALDARGLPPLERGEFYQAWMKNAAGTLVPIGSFSSSNDPVTLWSGVSPRYFPTLTITIERNDNNQASSGQRVLMGDVHPR